MSLQACNSVPDVNTVLAARVRRPGHVYGPFLGTTAKLENKLIVFVCVEVCVIPHRLVLVPNRESNTMSP